MEFVTPNGKVMELYNEGFAVKVRFTTGGELPRELSGSWTNKLFAIDSINKYLDNKQKKFKE